MISMTLGGVRTTSMTSAIFDISMNSQSAFDPGKRRARFCKLDIIAILPNRKSLWRRLDSDLPRIASRHIEPGSDSVAASQHRNISVTEIMWHSSIKETKHLRPGIAMIFLQIYGGRKFFCLIHLNSRTCSDCR
jgi:hypothetical protein